LLRLFGEHRSEIIFGVLVVVLCGDRIAILRFSSPARSLCCSHRNRNRDQEMHRSPPCRQFSRITREPICPPKPRTSRRHKIVHAQARCLVLARMRSATMSALWSQQGQTERDPEIALQRQRAAKRSLNQAVPEWGLDVIQWRMMAHVDKNGWRAFLQQR
jgi:hypothetical protein